MPDGSDHEIRSVTPEGGAETVSAPELISFHLKDKVEYIFPGGFVNEMSSEELSGRTAEDLAKDADRSSFAFRTFKVLEGKVKVGDEIVDIQSGHFKVSGTSYIDGDIYTLDRVKTEIGDNTTLVSNMESNHYDKVVRTRMGNWQPFKERDSVVSTKPQ